MLGFSEDQVGALSAKLSARHVRTRQANGRTLSYIEGWHAIAEANRIFGFDAWDRQTLAIKCVWEGPWQGKYTCAYVARVRVKVRAGNVEICREGCGAGHGRGETPGEAHESALKEAETDAMKRALTTFGNPFGLALYDKDQHGVRGRVRHHTKANGHTVSWILLSAEGEVISLHEDPVDYCKALRQAIEAAASPERLKALWSRNAVTIEMLRSNFRDLRTEKGEHYADILLGLYRRQLRERHEEQEAHQAEASAGADRSGGPAAVPEHRADSGEAGAPERSAQADEPDRRVRHGNGNPDRPGEVRPSNRTAGAEKHDHATAAERIDKSNLPISAPRRIRDKAHLRFVASRPCLVCGRSPGQAHHLRFAQPRAMGRKVSDEWVVPLCATHHRLLHSVGDEKAWWAKRQIDPLAHAERLWQQARHQTMPIKNAGQGLRGPAG